MHKNILNKPWARYNKANNSKFTWTDTKNIETQSSSFITANISPNKHTYLPVRSEKEFHTMLTGS